MLHLPRVETLMSLVLLRNEVSSVSLPARPPHVLCCDCPDGQYYATGRRSNNGKISFQVLFYGSTVDGNINDGEDKYSNIYCGDNDDDTVDVRYDAYPVNADLVDDSPG
ncbi:hypothetical protein NDU88_001675 [Pleurodeles waltl]|uniref:Uncharacterized protein n=1 Tax=Pleurodeles waltl TaxID=8319 RepID=A0AAV7WMG2_PLEWA|nr:hypothetical protein NDU88_001675 [Pleurodeles waltl]